MSPTHARTIQQTDPWSPHALLVPSARYLALFVLAASLVLPPSGLGFDLCWLHRFTGLPCPGCGMTRALIAFSAGDWSAALALHPFVLFAYPLFLVLGASALFPSGWAARLDGWFARHARGVVRAYRTCVVAFIGFGAARLLLFIVWSEKFP